MSSRNARRGFLESPAGMGLYLLWLSWTAASSGTPTWVRVGAGVLVVVCLALPAQTLVSRARRTRDNPRRERPTPHPPA